MKTIVYRTAASVRAGRLRSLLRGAAMLWLAAPLWAAGFDLQGHRGARGLEPENTLPAFERALALGVHTLELDVGLTADGVLVVAHDPLLNPAIARDASGAWILAAGPAIRSLTVAQLKAYDVGRLNPQTPYAKGFAEQQARDGTRTPTLAEVFARARVLGAEAVRYNIETKLNPLKPGETAEPQAIVEVLLRTLADAGVAERVTIQSFDWRTLQLVQKAAPQIPTVYLSIQTTNTDNIRDGAWTAGFKIAEHGSVPRLVKAAGGAVWSPNGGALTEALLKEAQGLGLKVIPWTINNPADMERFIGWGVDGLITDYPDRALGVMRQRGMALPKAFPPR